MVTMERSLAHRETTVRWFGVLIAIAACGLALAVGWRFALSSWLLGREPLKVLLLILLGGIAAAGISHNRRSLSLDNHRFRLALLGYGCSLAAPVVFFAFIAVTSPLTGTSNSILYAVFAVAQFVVYVVTTGWFAWHRRWLPTTALVVAIVPLVGFQILSGFYAACTFFSECI
jgi:hypothetical protein